MNRILVVLKTLILLLMSLLASILRRWAPQEPGRPSPTSSSSGLMTSSVECQRVFARLDGLHNANVDRITSATGTS